jgi:hypothetical protein
VRVGELVTSHLAYFIGFIEGNSGGEEEMRGEGVQGGRKQPAESKEHPDGALISMPEKVVIEAP